MKRSVGHLGGYTTWDCSLAIFVEGTCLATSTRSGLETKISFNNEKQLLIDTNGRKCQV